MTQGQRKSHLYLWIAITLVVSIILIVIDK